MQQESQELLITNWNDEARVADDVVYLQDGQNGYLAFNVER